MSFPAFPAQLCVPDMHTLARLPCPLVTVGGGQWQNLTGGWRATGRKRPEHLLPFPLCLGYRPDQGLWVSWLRFPLDRCRPPPRSSCPLGGARAWALLTPWLPSLCPCSPRVRGPSWVISLWVASLVPFSPILCVTDSLCLISSILNILVNLHGQRRRAG